MFIIINITCAISIEPAMADEILNSYILSYIELYELTLNAIILIRNNKNDSVFEYKQGVKKLWHYAYPSWN